MNNETASLLSQQILQILSWKHCKPAKHYEISKGDSDIIMVETNTSRRMWQWTWQQTQDHKVWGSIPTTSHV